MKKTLGILLVFALCIGCLGVGSAEGNFNETGFPIVNETVTYTFFAPHNSAVEDYYTNTFVLNYEEMTNVHIEWDLVPPSGLNEKKSLKFASYDLPDAFFGAGITSAEAVRYGAEGALLPVEDLMDRYNPEMQKMFEDIPGLRDLLVCPDGHIYQYPSQSTCYHCTYPKKFYINVKWLDNLGLEMPTTTDELYEVLKAFKEQDANGNGDPDDEIPMSAASNGWSQYPEEWIMNAFIYSPRDSYTYIVDGKLYFSAQNEQFKEGLLFLRKLYAEGLLDNECFVMDDEMLRQKMLSGDVSTVGAAPCMHYLGLVGVDGERPTEYDSLPPITGPNGYKSAHYDPYQLDKGKFVITTECESPEILARWIDYFYTEEGLLAQKYGIENQEWYRPAEDSGEMGHGEGLDPAPARFNWMPGKSWSETLQNVTLNQQGPIYETREFRGAWTADMVNAPLEPNLIEDTKPYEGSEQEEFWTDLIVMTLEETEEIAPIQEQLVRYVNEMVASFVSGQTDIETGWDSFQNELKNMGVERFLEIRQAAYDRYIGADGN